MALRLCSFFCDSSFHLRTVITILQNPAHPTTEAIYLPTTMANTSHFTTILTEPVQHPYYPQTASIPQYTPNINSVFYLLTTFFSACLTLISTTYTLTTHINPKLTRTQLATVIWFVLSGSIHVFFEGFYVAHFADLAGNQSLMGQMWKEYALSDSRYLTENSLVLCLEGITTVIWGPGCFLCAWLVAKGHPGRWGIVGVVSLGELLGKCCEEVGLVDSQCANDVLCVSRRCRLLRHFVFRSPQYGHQLFAA